jgi:hypothetical protein
MRAQGDEMKAMGHRWSWKQAAGVTVGTMALAFTFACNRVPEVASVQAQQLQAAQAGSPVVVSCEPHQRALVRPAVVNGAPVSQVECVAAAADAVSVAQNLAYAPAGRAFTTPATVTAPRRAAQPVYSDLGDAQVVPVSSTAARPVRTRQVIYDERPVRKTRSVAKSAIIIGSSAGAGAGVGAAIGGKKGALIGAAIGGGGAAVWDQVTRRK